MQLSAVEPRPFEKECNEGCQKAKKKTKSQIHRGTITISNNCNLSHVDILKRVKTDFVLKYLGGNVKRIHLVGCNLIGVP